MEIVKTLAQTASSALIVLADFVSSEKEKLSSGSSLTEAQKKEIKDMLWDELNELLDEIANEQQDKRFKRKWFG